MFVQHALRGEAGIYYEDLYPLVCFLPKFATKPPDIIREQDTLPLWGEEINDKEVQVVHKLQRALSNPSDRKELKAAEKHVRGDDLVTNQQQIIPGRGRTDTLFDPEAVLPNVKANRPLKPSRNPPKTTLYDHLPMLIVFKPITSGLKSLHSMIRRRIRGHPEPTKEEKE